MSEQLNATQKDWIEGMKSQFNDKQRLYDGIQLLGVITKEGAGSASFQADSGRTTRKANNLKAVSAYGAPNLRWRHNL